MPIDKDDKRESASAWSAAKAAWAVVIVFLATLIAAFLLGAWTHYVVELFMGGWDAVG